MKRKESWLGETEYIKCRKAIALWRFRELVKRTKHIRRVPVDIWGDLSFNPDVAIIMGVAPLRPPREFFLINPPGGAGKPR